MLSRRTKKTALLRMLLAGAASAAIALTGALPAAAEDAPTATISGQVTREDDGTPVENVEVSVSPIAGGVSYNDYTDASGAYSVVGLPAGEYLVHFSPLSPSGLEAEYWDDATDYFSADRLQAAGGETIVDIDAALAPTPVPGSISGIVLREDDGAPVAGATVSASATGGSWGWGSTTTGADGSYTLSNLRPGSYVLTFQAEGTDLVTEYWDNATSWSAATQLALSAGAAVVGIDAELATGGAIAGTVVRAADGAPIAGAMVSALDRNGEIKRQTQAGSDGAYRLDGLADGSYAIQFSGGNDPSLALEFWQNARTQPDATPVATIAGQTVSEIDASLEGVGHIAGTVSKASDGTPPFGTSIMVLDAVSGDFAGSGWSRMDGTFDIAVAPGTYHLKFDALERGLLDEYWDDALTVEDATPITLTETGLSGLDVRLDAAALITGTVSLVSNEDRELLVEAYDGATRVAAIVADSVDGSYQLYVPAGTYTIKASAAFLNDSTTSVKPQWSGGVKKQKKATPVTVSVDAPVSGMDFTLVVKTGK
ncbi:MAG TPA: carboxypeptidase-like regulatory domain-containing protein [Microbacterium sp.]|nr:carboxypeptidase-like regulatory domain-containing protein [Microbacterium sp.]